jgi:hypothetical protein
MKKKAAVALDTQYLRYCFQIQTDLAEHMRKLPICAEHNRRGQIFRAHPNYRGKGPWRDWVMVEWTTGEYPAQIWGFLDLSELPAGVSVALQNGTVVQQGVWAVIESYNYSDSEQQGTDDVDLDRMIRNRRSEIFTPIILDTDGIDADGEPDPSHRKFYLVDVDTFKRPLVVIPNIGTKCEYLMMTPRDQWGLDFARWVEASHRDDEQEMQDNPIPDPQTPPPPTQKKTKQRKRKARKND